MELPLRPNPQAKKPKTSADLKPADRLAALGASKNKAKKTRKRPGLGAYFLGMLLMPWIWIWGYFALTVILFGLLIYRNPSETNPVFVSYNLQGLTPFAYWVFAGVSVWINYSLAFWTKKSIPKLGTLLFCHSLIIMLIFMFVLWPVFRIFLA